MLLSRSSASNHHQALRALPGREREELSLEPSRVNVSHEETYEEEEEDKAIHTNKSRSFKTTHASGLMQAMKSSFASNFVPLFHPPHHHREEQLQAEKFNNHTISENGKLKSLPTAPQTTNLSYNEERSNTLHSSQRLLPHNNTNNKTISQIEGFRVHNNSVNRTNEEMNEEDVLSETLDDCPVDPNNTSPSIQNQDSSFNVNSSLNTTFSEMFTRLLGREKRRPHCTAPIRTVIVVPYFLKEQYEKHAENEKMAKSQVSTEECARDVKSQKSMPSQKNHHETIDHLESNENVTNEVSIEYEDMGRNPSLSPCIRSVTIYKKEWLVGVEENVRTRFVGERDLERYLDIEGANYRLRRKSKGGSRALEKQRNLEKQQPNEEGKQQQDLQRPTKSRRVFLPDSVQISRMQQPPPYGDSNSSEMEPKSSTSSLPDSSNIHQIKSSKRMEEEKLGARQNSDAANSTTSNSLTILSQENISNHIHVMRWIERDLGISMPSTVQCESELKNGLKLAEIVARLESEERTKGLNKQPQTKAALYNNVERVLSVLRENKAIELRYLWSVKEINSGNPDVIWGLLTDIFEAYKRRTSKVKTRSRKKKYNDGSKEEEMVEKIEEISKNVHTNQASKEMNEERQRERNSSMADDVTEAEEFSIEDINRLKQELLNSVLSDEQE
nr:unnamed protein product [Naegleria fowleri]